MGQTPLFAILTDTEYVCPPIGLNRAHHCADSAALLPVCMQIRFPCVCRSGVGKRTIWNWLSGDQLISTQSIPPQLVSEVLSPQIAPLSCLLLPQLSTLVDCYLGWVAQHLQAFCMLDAHRHHIVVVPLSSYNCHLLAQTLKRCCCCHQHCHRWQQQRHCHHCCCHCSCCSCLCHHRRCCHYWRCFNDIALSSLLCYLAANWRSWTKPLLPKLSTLVDWCLEWVAQHLQAFCMSLPPISITSLSSHCFVQSPSSNCRPWYAAVSSLTSLPLAAAAASLPSPSPLP